MANSHAIFDIPIFYTPRIPAEGKAQRGHKGRGAVGVDSRDGTDSSGMGRSDQPKESWQLGLIDS